MRRRVPSKRGGHRAVVSARGADDAIALDNRPLDMRMGRDGKRILATLPYEIWVINGVTREVERTIELPSRRPAPFEAEDGALWIGGSHLYHGSRFKAAATKVGTRLGGFVDRVGLLRPTLLCGIGSHGEVLWDTEEETAVHRRRASEREILGFRVAPDGRALFADGSPAAWVMDPEHPAGHMQLRLKRTSQIDVPAEGIVRLGATTEGRCLLAARDGAVGWTNRALRLDGEVFPRGDGARAPLCLTGDARWVMVLRPGGVLQRFLIAQPEPTEEDPEPEPLPEAQECRIPRGPTTMALAPGGELWLAGASADGQLGRLWSVQPDSLEWSPLRLGKRRQLETTEEESRAPAFVATRNKLDGPALSSIPVDEVISGFMGHRVTHGHGVLTERPVVALPTEEVLPGDALLLPAMIRFQEGTARPGLLLWPGSPHDDRPAPELEWLAWGDDPRGWLALRTPEIREQGWTRRAVFPLQAALATPPPEVAGQRARIPDRWVDAELFAAMARECKKMLKVLW